MALVVAFGVTISQAKEEKGSGRGMYTAKEVDSMKLADGTTVRNTHDNGFITGNEPGNPFDGTCHDCFATEILAADGSMIQRKGHCVGFDPNGSTWTISFGEGKPGHWTIIGATGKYKGMEGGGTFDLKQRWPDGRYFITWDGTWEKK